MKILLVNHYAIPPTSPGGTRHYSLAKALQVRGHEVLIAAASYDHFGRFQQTVSAGTQQSETVAGVEFLWLQTPGYSHNDVRRLINMLAFSWRVGRLRLPASFGKPDVILGSSPHPFAALAASYVARRRKVPFILEVRDIWPASLIELAGVSRSHPIVRILGGVEGAIYRRASKIVSVVPAGAAHFQRFGVNPGSVFYVPNGVDFDLAPIPQPPPRRSEFIVLYAGSMGPPNALDTVVEAAQIIFSRGLPVRFILIGDGPDRGRLEARASRAGLRCIEFKDPVPKDVIYNEMQRADALVMTMQDRPLYRAGMSSNKLWDYMASARPIVIANASSIDPVAEADAGISVAAENAPALADAIEHLMSLTSSERWEMGLRGRRYVEDHHSYEQLAKRLEDVFMMAVAECQ
jgi:glycosyltransferase involved in cell wall biosynthesis